MNGYMVFLTRLTLGESRLAGGGDGWPVALKTTMLPDLASDSDQEIETCAWWRLARTQFLIGKHLRDKGIPTTVGQGRWALGYSPLGGRGLFATCDLEPNQLVYIDAPLVLGPRASLLAKPVCVGCHRQLHPDEVNHQPN